MSEIWVPIFVAVVTGIASVAGVVITTNSNNAKMQAKLEQTQAVFEAHVTEQIGQLRKEVEQHNKVIERTFELEKGSVLHEAELLRLGKRISALEGGIK